MNQVFSLKCDNVIVLLRIRPFQRCLQKYLWKNIKNLLKYNLMGKEISLFLLPSPHHRLKLIFFSSFFFFLVMSGSMQDLSSSTKG